MRSGNGREPSLLSATSATFSVGKEEEEEEEELFLREDDPAASC